VVESGTHAGLFAAAGPYRRLWDAFRQHGVAATVDQLSAEGSGGAGSTTNDTNDHLVNGSTR
jgi:ATP-binding cassette subfamily B protein